MVLKQKFKTNKKLGCQLGPPVRQSTGGKRLGQVIHGAKNGSVLAMGWVPGGHCRFWAGFRKKKQFVDDLSKKMFDLFS